MRKITSIRICPLLIIGVFLVVVIGCKKDDDKNPTSDNQTNGKTTAVFNPDVSYGKMTDQDGNVYKTVTIGLQTWMAENLRTTKYNDGTAIPNITADDEWGCLTMGAYCNHNNTGSNDTIATFGRLYNWHAVNTGKLAPTGWHVPTDDEWSTLTNYLGGTGVAGKLKEAGTSHWSSPNTGATNETGFTTLPGGDRYGQGSFGSIGKIGYWWSSSEFDTLDAWYRNINNLSNNVVEYIIPKQNGLSVRCVRD